MLTLATFPLFQAIVTASQLVSEMTPNVSGVALPVDAGAPLKVLGFGDCHRPIGFPIRAPVAGEKGAQNERPTRRLVERPGPSQEYRICQNEPYATLRGSREGDDA